MSNVFIRIQSAQKAKTYQHTCRTALSLIIGGFFCSAVPAWAACVNEGQNENGGFDFICEGVDIDVSTSAAKNYNVITIQGDNTNVTSYVYGGKDYISTSGIRQGITTHNTVIVKGNSSISGRVMGAKYIYMENLLALTSLI